MIPGTYVVTAPGYMGENTVHVTVDETSILNVAVAESTDVPAYLTQFPIAQIPAAIVGNQSTSVDVVSGATFTSFSIMNAVEAALEQAGGKGLFTAAPAKAEKVAGETVTSDAAFGAVATAAGGEQSLDAAKRAVGLNSRASSVSEARHANAGSVITTVGDDSHECKDPAEAAPPAGLAPQHDSHLGPQYLAFAEHYGLTRRECVMLGVFVQGRSMAYIAEKLFVSENTVKTHIRHAYEKCGVHNKQEMIDLVESSLQSE